MAIRTWALPNVRRLAKEFSIMATGQAIVLVASVLAVKVLTVTLARAEYGRLALGMTLAMLLNQLVFGPLTLALMRYYAICAERNQQRDLARVAAEASGVLALIVIVVGVPICWLISRGLGTGWLVILTGMLIYGIGYSVQGYFGALFSAARRRASAAASQLVDPLVRLGGGMTAAQLVPHSAGAVAWAFAAAMLTAVGIQARSYWRSLPPQSALAAERKALRIKLWNYGKYFLLWGAFAWMQSSGDRWALKTYVGDAAVGIYAYAFQLASIPALVIAGAIPQFLNPIIFQRAGDATDVERRNASVRVTVLGVGLLTILTIGAAGIAKWFGEPIAVTFASSQFREAGQYIWILIFGLGAVQIGNMVAMIPLALNRLRGHVVVKILTGVITVGINFYAAEKFGVRGVVVANVVCGLIYCALTTANSLRLLTTRHVGNFGTTTPLNREELTDG